MQNGARSNPSSRHIIEKNSTYTRIMSFFRSDAYSHYLDLPKPETLFNPLIDVDSRYREESEMVEFCKLCTEHFSPEFGFSTLLNRNLFPFQMSTIRAIQKHKFPMLLFTRGGSKTHTLGGYATYHAAMNPGCRIILISGTFRQSKLIFKEIMRLYDEAPLLQAITTKKPVIANDNCNFHVNGSTIIGLPLGAGDKIRGERGHVVLVDEFDSIAKEVFDVVIRGFGATQSDPWMKNRDILLRLKKLKSSPQKVQNDASSMMEIMDAAGAGNKIVVSGTAGHHTGPFAKLHDQYSKIIHHKMQGNLKNYFHAFGEMDVDENVTVDYKQYCIVKYNYLDLPAGMMDVQMIHNARATMSKMYFNMEYMCQFADDSMGFFKYKDIRGATQPAGGWTAVVRGRHGKQYVMGVDPARTIDRFAVTIIELGQPNKVAYVWTSQNWKITKSMEYMRDLMRRFNVIGIALDATGGTGVMMKDFFGDPVLMKEGDRPIVPYDAKTEEIPENGQRILYPIVFAPVWIEEANVLLQKAIEERTLQFPVENLADTIKDKDEFQLQDDATDEINQAKREIMSIEISYNITGSKRFNLKPPSLKAEPGEAVLHKDRYTSMLLANYLACKMGKMELIDPDAAARAGFHDSVGGWLEDFA